MGTGRYQYQFQPYQYLGGKEDVSPPVDNNDTDDDDFDVDNEVA
jgi:hypothetical protein